MCVWEDSLHVHPGDSGTHVMSVATSQVRIGFSYRTPLDDAAPWDVSAVSSAPAFAVPAGGDYGGEVVTSRGHLRRDGACPEAEKGDAVDVALDVAELRTFDYPAVVGERFAATSSGLFLDAPGCALLTWQVPEAFTLVPYLGVAAHALVAKLDPDDPFVLSDADPAYTAHLHGAWPQDVNRDEACAMTHVDFGSTSKEGAGATVVASALFPEPGVYQGRKERAKVANFKGS